MSQSLEIPDPIFDALQQAATASGTTPVGWIAAHLPATKPELDTQGAKSLYDLLKDHIGKFRSDGKEALSENTGQKFTDYLVQKKREGRL
jgi:hypothetical protein